MIKRIATFDLESNGFLEDATVIWCATVKDHEDGTRKSFTPDNISELCAWLDTFDTLIGHNCIAFDFPVLRKIYGWEYRGTKIDTLLMSRTQRPNRVLPKNARVASGPHSVESWGLRLGTPKQEHNEWDRFSQEMLSRCEQDVEIQVRIYEALIEEGKGEGWENAHRLNAKLFHYLQKQEEYGWLVDRALLESCLATLDRWIDRIDKSIGPRLPLLTEPLETKKDGEYGWIRKPFTKSGGYSASAINYLGDKYISNLVGPFSRVAFRKVDPDSNQEVKEFLLKQGWEPEEWNTNNEGKRTSPKLSKNDDFNGIQGGLGRLVAKRIQCRQRKGILEGWKNNIRSDGRLSATVAGMATTGRLRHKGLVNVPTPHSNAFFAKYMRRLFIAKPGWVLVGTDSKGNQIRQLAARMDDRDFTDAVLFGTAIDGTDLHSLNQRRAKLPSRNLAKNFFYGLIFGAGDAKIGKIIGGSAKEGGALKTEYFNNLPKLREFLDRAVDGWRKTAQKWFNKKYNRMEYRNGYIRGLDGRPILVESEHTILVYYLQSDEAIHMSTAYCILHKWLERSGYKWGEDYGSVIFMHDEWQIECRKEIAKRVAELANEAISWAGRFYNIVCPHEGESKIGKSWYETH